MHCNSRTEQAAILATMGLPVRRPSPAAAPMHPRAGFMIAAGDNHCAICVGRSTAGFIGKFADDASHALAALASDQRHAGARGDR